MTTAFWVFGLILGGGIVGAVTQILFTLPDQKRDATDVAELTEDVIHQDMRIAHALHVAECTGQSDIAAILRGDQP